MTSYELVNKFPECPHRVENYCGWISEKVGRLYGVSPLICNRVCASAGPHCGKPAIAEESFLKKMWSRMSPLGGENLARRVVANYAKPANIIIPKIWPEIKNALAGLQSESGFVGLLLTGSVILNRPQAPKDLDVVLHFQTAADAVKCKQRLPETIAGIKTDYFYYIGNQPDVYFACLDCDAKKLFLSRWLPLTIESIAPGIEVIRHEENQFGQAIRELLNQPPNIKKQAASGWNGVFREWDKLTKFVAAARSRGILATAKHVAGLDNTDGFHVDEATYKLRSDSCFGSESKPACPVLVTNAKGHRFCGACGCGETQIARLDADTPEGYTKLHYPALRCPLNREGFIK